jgi:hypothetical protein
MNKRVEPSKTIQNPRTVRIKGIQPRLGQNIPQAIQNFQILKVIQKNQTPHVIKPTRPVHNKFSFE